MTKEELEKEAEEWTKEHSGLIGGYKFVKYDYDSMQKAYLAGAEPREKQIQALGERCLQLQKDKGNLTDRVRELEEQIEKMKCCYNCANDTLEPPEVIGNGICEHCKNHDKWELEY